MTPAGLILAAGQRGRAAWLGLLTLAAALTEGFGLVMLVPMLDALSAAAGTPGAAGAIVSATGLQISIGPLLVLFVALVLTRALIVLARNLVAQRFEHALVDSLRQRAWRALLGCDWRVLSRQRRTDSTSLLVTTVDRVGFGINQLFMAAANAATLAALGLATLAIGPGAALGLALGGLVVLLAHHPQRRRAGQLGEMIGEAYRAVHGGFGEGMGALRAIKSQGAEAAAQAAALDGIADLRRAQRAYLRATGLGQLALQTLGAGVLAAVVWLATSRWQMGAAAVLPLVALVARAVPLLGALQGNWQHWRHARPALDETLVLIAETEAAREEPADGHPAPTLTGALAIEDAWVHFPGQHHPALAAASLTLPARGLTVLTGASGAGKSTLADLAGGLISPDSGRVLIDGVTLAGPLRQAWRQCVGYVQQDPALLAGTVRDNLCWGSRGYEEARLQAVLTDAAADFVVDLPQGLDTRVGDGGRLLSGGERQRLMLARALLRDPALLILDEATSALDPANEAAIATVLARLKARMAILVIAHRGALTALADQVVTLEAGRIAAISRMNGRE